MASADELTVASADCDVLVEPSVLDEPPAPVPSVDDVLPSPVVVGLVETVEVEMFSAFIDAGS